MRRTLIQRNPLRANGGRLVASHEADLEEYLVENKAIQTKLLEMGLEVRAITRMGDDDGWRFSVANGAIVHNFDDGRLIVHGPGASAIRLVLLAKSNGSTRKARTAPHFL